MSDTYNFHGETQFIKEAKDNVSINQNIYKDSPELIRKMDELFSEINTKYESKLDEIISKQSESNANYEKTVSDLKVQIQNMLDETLSVIGIGLEYLDGEEQRRFEELKHKADWENTLTFTVPLLDKIGIKIETKTKLEKLPEKFKDQIALFQDRAKEMMLSESKATEIEESKVKGELKE